MAHCWHHPPPGLCLPDAVEPTPQSPFHQAASLSPAIPMPPCTASQGHSTISSPFYHWPVPIPVALATLRHAKDSRALIAEMKGYTAACPMSGHKCQRFHRENPKLPILHSLSSARGSRGCSLETLLCARSCGGQGGGTHTSVTLRITELPHWGPARLSETQAPLCPGPLDTTKLDREEVCPDQLPHCTGQALPTDIIPAPAAGTWGQPGHRRPPPTHSPQLQEAEV